jgi:hypothetical protein
MISKRNSLSLSVQLISGELCLRRLSLARSFALSLLLLFEIKSRIKPQNFLYFVRTLRPAFSEASDIEWELQHRYVIVDEWNEICQLELIMIVWMHVKWAAAAREREIETQKDTHRLITIVFTSPKWEQEWSVGN